MARRSVGSTSKWNRSRHRLRLHRGPTAPSFHQWAPWTKAQVRSSGLWIGGWKKQRIAGGEEGRRGGSATRMGGQDRRPIAYPDSTSSPSRPIPMEEPLVPCIPLVEVRLPRFPPTQPRQAHRPSPSRCRAHVRPALPAIFRTVRGSPRRALRALLDRPIGGGAGEGRSTGVPDGRPRTVVGRGVAPKHDPHAAAALTCALPALRGRCKDVPRDAQDPLRSQVRSHERMEGADASSIRVHTLPGCWKDGTQHHRKTR